MVYTYIIEYDTYTELHSPTQTPNVYEWVLLTVIKYKLEHLLC